MLSGYLHWPADSCVDDSFRTDRHSRSTVHGELLAIPGYNSTPNHPHAPNNTANPAAGNITTVSTTRASSGPRPLTQA
jgi:hypothetical protein